MWLMHWNGRSIEMWRTCDNIDAGKLIKTLLYSIEQSMPNQRWLWCKLSFLLCETCSIYIFTAKFDRIGEGKFVMLFTGFSTFFLFRIIYRNEKKKWTLFRRTSNISMEFKTSAKSVQDEFQPFSLLVVTHIVWSLCFLHWCYCRLLSLFHIFIVLVGWWQSKFALHFVESKLTWHSAPSTA